MKPSKMSRKKTKDEYRMRTHLIHGNFESKKWEYSHHVNHYVRFSHVPAKLSASRLAGFF